MGEELVGWNLEQMHYVNLAFAKFWPVDILHFRAYLGLIVHLNDQGV